MPAGDDRKDKETSEGKLMTKLEYLLEEIVTANRILAREAVVDSFGHVSARHPDNPQRFLLSRARAPDCIEKSDIMEFTLEGAPIEAGGRAPYLERFIHGEIYARRPDVASVVHSHAAAVVPFTASRVELKPIYHMSSFLHAGAPVFEIREKFGMTDMLIRNGAQGAALAETIGTGAVVLMRGHGYCAVGADIPEAVFRAYYTQVNAELQQRATGLGGEISFLSGEEGALYDATNRNVIGRPWALWKAKFAPKP
jgi:ribulose-5-phosphate 4-epimerase/fuculose-1-phosphate aldolase